MRPPQAKPAAKKAGKGTKKQQKKHQEEEEGDQEEEAADEEEEKPAAKKKAPASKAKKQKEGGEDATGAAAAAAPSQRPKKVYDMPGQTRDAPGEEDPLYKFYMSLLEQRPESEMARKWAVQHGLLPKDEALEWLAQNRKKGSVMSPAKTSRSARKPKSGEDQEEEEDFKSSRKRAPAKRTPASGTGEGKKVSAPGLAAPFRRQAPPTACVSPADGCQAEKGRGRLR